MLLEFPPCPPISVTSLWTSSLSPLPVLSPDVCVTSCSAVSPIWLSGWKVPSFASVWLNGWPLSPLTPST